MISTVNTFKVAKQNIFVILGLFTLFFLMTYSEGLHEGVRFFRYHYVLLAFMTVCFLVDSIIAKRQPYRVKLDMGTKTACLLFLLQIINASLFSGQAHITAIHVVVWHAWSYVFFVFLLSRFYPRDTIKGIAVACLGIYLLACVALIVGIYMKYIGEINVGGLTVAQSIYRGTDYRRLTSWCTSPNRTGPLFLYGIVAGLILYNLDASKRRRQFILISMIGLAVGIVLSGSRSAIISTVVMLGGALLLTARVNITSGRRGYSPIIVAVFALVAIAAGVLIQREEVVEKIKDLTRLEDSILVSSEGIIIVGREFVYEAALDVHRSAPLRNQLFGVGPGGILSATGISSHSGWLNVIVEEGFVGAVLLLLVFSAIARGLYSAYVKRKTTRRLRVLYGIQMAFWVSFALLNFTTSIIPVPRADSFFMCMMLAIYAYCGRIAGNTNIDPSLRKALKGNVSDPGDDRAPLMNGK